jgi:glycosyltransferase involved in cell wall biosynthesis
VRAELGAAPDDEIVIAVGSLTWQKDHAALLEAFAAVARARPRVFLWLVGDGPRRAALDRQRAALGLADRVRFLGLRADVPDLLAAADVFAMSSVREGLPVSLLEAMRAGCPSVATAIGGCPELIVDGETGRIVAPLDSVALAAAITELLADPARARAMGAAGRRRWSAGYTAAAMVSGTENVYREILGARRDARTHGVEDADVERHVATH